MNDQHSQYGPPQGQQPHGGPQYGPPQSTPPYGRQPQQMPGPYGYQQQPMPYPPQQLGPRPGSRNGLGIAALVIGIIGCVSALMPGLYALGFWLAIPAVILAAMGLARAKVGTATNRGITLAGLILGLVSVGLSIVMYAASTSTRSRPTPQQVADCMNNPATDTADEIWACTG